MHICFSYHNQRKQRGSVGAFAMSYAFEIISRPSRWPLNPPCLLDKVQELEHNLVLRIPHPRHKDICKLTNACLRIVCDDIIGIWNNMASLAQLAEHALRKRMVRGSIPPGGLSTSSVCAIVCLCLRVFVGYIYIYIYIMYIDICLLHKYTHMHAHTRTYTGDSFSAPDRGGA